MGTDKADDDRRSWKSLAKLALAFVHLKLARLKLFWWRWWAATRRRRLPALNPKHFAAFFPLNETSI